MSILIQNESIRKSRDIISMQIKSTKKSNSYVIKILLIHRLDNGENPLKHFKNQQ